MFSIKRKEFILYSVILLMYLIFNGCAATLAPQYDKAVVEGLTATNTDAMEFFASVCKGTQNDTYDQREAKYARIIGHFDALGIQAKARPLPENKVIDKINDVLSKRGVPIQNDSEIPSATAMGKISLTFAKMRDTDQKQGLTPFEVEAFKRQVSIYMDQALTYESFLER
jgi:hypothetical protein